MKQQINCNLPWSWRMTIVTIILLGLPLLSFAQAASKAVSLGVVNGKVTKLPLPVYPPAAKAVHASGSVNVQVTIDETGKVVSAVAVSGHPLLRSAAEASAKQAEFEPTLQNKKAIPVTGILVYNFMTDGKVAAPKTADKDDAKKSKTDNESAGKEEKEDQTQNDSANETPNAAEGKASGQKLEGRYRSSGSMLYYTFQPDGTFIKATAGGTADSAYGTKRPGSYYIEGNTITLKFSDGATDQFSFEILENKDLKINGLTFWVWNN